MKRLFAALGTCGLAIGIATAGDPPPASAPTVSQLVERLGSGDFREREAATAALHKAGPGAIPALREAAKSDDPEVRQRATGVLFRLQRAADSNALLAPKKVTLAYRDAPLGTAVNDLSARTGIRIVLDPDRIADPLRTVTCVAVDVPVWEAIDRFCAAAGLEEAFPLELDAPKAKNDRRGYVALPQPPAPDAVPVTLIDGKSRPPGARGSAVRVTPLPRSFAGHKVTLGTGETTLCFDIAPAPGLNWQEVVAVKVHKLTDDAGRVGAGGTANPAPLRTETDVVVAWAGGPGMGFAPAVGMGRFDPRTGQPIPPERFPNPRIVPVPLKLGTPTAKSIKRLEGCVVGEIQVPNQTLVTIADPMRKSGTGVDGPGQTRLTVVSATEGTAQAGPTLQVTVQFPSPWLASARRGFNPGGLWPEAPRSVGQTPFVRALDAAGKDVPNQASNGGWGGASDDGQTFYQNLVLTFPKGAAAPAKLVLVGPRPVVVEVPFVLEDVPLP